MATLILSTAGAAAGAAIGGSAASLAGRALGAAAGGLIDQAVLGGGSAAVETPRLERLRVLGSREGAAIPRVFGRARVAGQVIWASRFRNRATTERSGGKGGPFGTPAQATTRRSYSVSLAVALCEGPIDRIGRIWADGRELATPPGELRLHRGEEDQAPDPLILALEGEGGAPAYRGVAYVVFEELDLAPFGDRVPQFNFEVFRQPRPASGTAPDAAPPLDRLIRGVALSPGSGEFSLETETIWRRLGPGRAVAENRNTMTGRPDLMVALDRLQEEAPECRSVSLVVSWFGDDLRCGRCRVTPAVETREKRTEPVRWRAGGLTRAEARVVGQRDGRPVYGGTPSDRSVVNAIREMKRRGLRVMFYPFLLMDVPPSSGKSDPYGGAEQAAYPWRGRITLDVAPGRPGSTDRTAAAAAETASFFGVARPDDFQVEGSEVRFAGAEEWSWRRFILHYAHLCAAAGGVDAFCVGSELRGLTRIRSAAASYPGVEALRRLVADVRGVLGPEAKIGYAADWSEYHSHRPEDGRGDVIFNMDPLWDACDFIGVDNYMPLSDWRDGGSHLDREIARSVYDLGYLKSNVAGGEYHDWWYATTADRLAQRRSPIVDAAYGEPWIWRDKDFAGWWSAEHTTRLDGVRGNIAPIYGRLSSVYSASSSTVITENFGVDDAGRPAARVQHAGSNNCVYRQFTDLAAGARYVLRVRAKSNTPGDQKMSLNYFVSPEGHHRHQVTVTKYWLDFELAFVAPTNVVNVYPSDPRGEGDDATDILISQVALQLDGAATAWRPRSKPIWFTEIGCPAVDKGANQPNVFHDPKSSESALPYFSSGAPDPHMQRRFLQAALSYWEDESVNPVSEIYGGRMVDVAAAHVWTWDARPWPDFPAREDVWSDGANHRLGHWITGRLGAADLAETVVELCEPVEVDVSGLQGVVEGFVVDRAVSAREALQPFMLSHAFDATESGDHIRFVHRGGAEVKRLAQQSLVASEDEALAASPVSVARAPAVDAPDVLRVRYVDAEGDYEVRAVEARAEDAPWGRVDEAETPVAMSEGLARRVAERWLREARSAAEEARFAVPPSAAALEPGDQIAVERLPGLWRIDRVTGTGAREIVARRIEPALYQARPAPEHTRRPAATLAAQPVEAAVVDAPVGDGPGPLIAVFADPWPGAVSVQAARDGEALAQVGFVQRPATMGVLVEDLAGATPGLWATGDPARVRLHGGELVSSTPLGVLNGANLAAIGGDGAPWELLQFRVAELVGEREYLLSDLLRGQAGTERYIRRPAWAGLQFVLLDGAPLPLPAEGAWRLPRRVRVGPAGLDHDDSLFVELSVVAEGAAWRPLAPAHLAARRVSNDVVFEWTRRSRHDADDWLGPDAPLEEAGERYRVSIRRAGALLRRAEVTAPEFVYGAAERSADGWGAVTVAVAQVFPRYGAGPEAEIRIDG